VKRSRRDGASLCAAWQGLTTSQAVAAEYGLVCGLEALDRQFIRRVLPSRFGAARSFVTTGYTSRYADVKRAVERRLEAVAA
jgi:hypothetical protein